MSDWETTIFYLQIAILTILARLGGEFASRLRLPLVVGELAVGVVLGPTVLRALWPNLQLSLFPAGGHNQLILAAIGTLGVSLFLLVAGMEVDLSLVKAEGRIALPVSLGGMIIPFTLGFFPAWLNPDLFGMHPSTHPVIFGLFIGAALSITSLPILARTLLDIGLYRSPFGMLVMSAAVFDDIFGWTIAGIVFSLDTLHDAGHFTLTPIVMMIGTVIAFVAMMLTVGRWVCNQLLFQMYRLCSQPGVVIGFVMGAALLGASLTQAIGIHGLFGAFVVGAVVGGSANLKKETRESIEGVVANFMAPLFFASVGLTIDFVANFSLPTVLLVFLIACAGKVFGCYLLARLSKVPEHLSRAVGIAMNGRGSIEIVLGMIALHEQIISERTFEALAIMAVGTSIVTGRYLRGMKDKLSEVAV